MDFSLSEEQRMMVDAARRLVEKHIQPILDANDKDRALPKPGILTLIHGRELTGIDPFR